MRCRDARSIQQPFGDPVILGGMTFGVFASRNLRHVYNRFESLHQVRPRQSTLWTLLTRHLSETRNFDSLRAARRSPVTISAPSLTRSFDRSSSFRTRARTESPLFSRSFAVALPVCPVAAVIRILFKYAFPQMVFLSLPRANKSHT